MPTPDWYKISVFVFIIVCITAPIPLSCNAHRQQLPADLRLMASVNDLSDLPKEGNNRIIVGAVKNVLHFRIFDADGKRVVDTDETRLADKAERIAELKSRLSGLWKKQQISLADKARVISDVTSIVDHPPATQTKQEDQLKLLMDYTQFHIGLYITLFTAVVAFLNYKKEPPGSTDVLLVVGILSFFIAGAAGGMIGSHISNYKKFDSFAWEPLAPLGIRPLQMQWGTYWEWARVEHVAFWIGATAVAAKLVIMSWPAGLFWETVHVPPDNHQSEIKAEDNVESFPASNDDERIEFRIPADRYGEHLKLEASTSRGARIAGADTDEIEITDGTASKRIKVTVLYIYYKSKSKESVKIKFTNKVKKEHKFNFDIAPKAQSQPRDESSSS